MIYLYENPASGDVTQAYVDGSLAIRDTSISYNLLQINQLDASVIRIDSLILDVSITTASNNDYLTYDSSIDKWVNISPLDGSDYFYTTDEVDNLFQPKLIFNTPDSSADGSIGNWVHDASYLYVCTSTNTWGRLLLELDY